MIQIGFIGLGKMGMPMLQRLRQAEFPVHAYARKPDVCLQAQTLGAQVKDSITEVASKAEVLIVCLYTDEQVQDLFLGTDSLLQHMRRDTTLIIHTTGSPATMEQIAVQAEPFGVNVLDVPVSGGPHNILAGEITLLAGGDAAVLERCRPVLNSYANPILHVGPLGCGQKTKLVNNLLFAANINLAAEASRLLEDLGADVTSSLQAITRCSGESAVLRMATRSGSVARLQASAGEFIRKDKAVALALANDLGADPGSLK